MKSLPVSRGNPYLTMIWLSIVGSTLLFLFLFFVFILRLNLPDWQKIGVPLAFVYSTVAILLSSASLHFANRSFKKEDFRSYYNWLRITVLLALSFAILQVAGWISVYKSGVSLSQIGVAFLFILTGLHGFHIALGLAGLIWVLFDAFLHRNYVDGYILSLNPVKTTLLRISTIFWHFLDVLWLIIFGLLHLA